MKILEVIDRVDSLYPNSYTIDEKLRWCDEVNAMISQEINEEYEALECDARENEEIALPDGIEFENIDCVYVDGLKLDKSDLRSYGLFPSVHGVMPCASFGRLRLIYIVPPKQIRNIEAIGTFNVSDNFIEMSLPSFETGDAVDIASEFDSKDEPYYKNSDRYYICSSDTDGIYLDRNLDVSGDDIRLAVKRVITDSTLAPPPYDVMYIEYILARMAHYQHDYDTYKACQSQFNSWLSSYMNWHKTRNPINRPIRFKRLW